MWSCAFQRLPITGVVFQTSETCDGDMVKLASSPGTALMQVNITAAARPYPSYDTHFSRSGPSAAATWCLTAMKLSGVTEIESIFAFTRSLANAGSLLGA